MIRNVASAGIRGWPPVHSGEKRALVEGLAHESRDVIEWGRLDQARALAQIDAIVARIDRGECGVFQEVVEPTHPLWRYAESEAIRNHERDEVGLHRGRRPANAPPSEPDPRDPMMARKVARTKWDERWD